MPKDTKTALLNSAEQAARARGFDGFSYADLSADVGIRKASIHHHFPTKAVLSVALMERYHAAFKEFLAEIDATHATGADRLGALIDRYRLALNGGRSLCLCVAFTASRESLSPEVVDQISQFRAMMTRWIETAFELAMTDGSVADVSNPKAEAAATLPLLEGAQLSARAEENPTRFDEALSLLTRRF